MAETRVARFFKDYSSHHKTKGNQISHYFGITMIVVSLLGLLGGIPVGTEPIQISPYLRVDGGTIFWALAMLWYLYLEWKLAIPFAFFTLGLYFVSRTIPTQVLWGMFVLGWIIQFIGHGVFEKKRPAFFKNVEHLLIGPFWIFAKFVGYKV